jgi:hypothetical protein
MKIANKMEARRLQSEKLNLVKLQIEDN